MKQSLIQALQNRLEEGRLLENQPLKEYTSFRIGGAASVLLLPKTAAELQACLRVLSEYGETPYIIGAGSNILAPDEGLDRVVICLRSMAEVRRVSENEIEAEAGALLSKTAVFAKNEGLSGLEFAHGIPGTVGGAVFMNAGAYGGEISQVCKAVTVLERSGEIRELSCDEAAFGYRTSRFEKSGEIVLCARFSLIPASSDEIGAKMAELLQRRRASQPLEQPSAGSTFKRPVGGYAAALIDQAGLKGLRIGGAAVSEKHAGFVVNLGGATAADVRALIAQIQEKVKENSGIQLEPEVRIW